MDGQRRRRQHLHQPGHRIRPVRRRSPQGAEASFNLQYESGAALLDQEMAQFKTDFAQAGIAINLTTAPFDTVIGNATPCKGHACTWDMGFSGGGWIFAPDYEPTGDELWSCTGSRASVRYAGSDSGGYCDPQAESDILATETSSNVQAMYTYEDYLAKQLPVIWLPVFVRQLSEINKDIKGTGPRIRCCRSTRRTGAGPEQDRASEVIQPCGVHRMAAPRRRAA